MANLFTPVKNSAAPAGIALLEPTNPNEIMKTCTACRQAAPDHASFCPACGAAFSPSATPPKQEPTWLKWLRKLGIYRSGAISAVYHNANERPIEFQMDGVLDASKDLVTKEDFRKQPPPVQGEKR